MIENRLLSDSSRSLILLVSKGECWLLHAFLGGQEVLFDLQLSSPAGLSSSGAISAQKAFKSGVPGRFAL